MRIVANHPEYRPTWLHTDVLDRLWQRSGTPFIATWRGIPVFPDWFEYDGERPVAFKTADMNLEVIADQGSIYFIDGRHRTRWLMNRFALVPVGLEERHFDEAIRLGLAARRVKPDDFIPTFDY